MPDLAELEKLLAELAKADFSQTSEPDTRERAVNPVIGALGWDVFNPGEVAREHPVGGGRVDYCLRGPVGDLVLIEVKRTGTDLHGHQDQLLLYAFAEGVPLAALTDGLRWWLYLTTATVVSWEQRCFSRIDFCKQDAADAASAMHRFLGREGVVGGTALDEARREFEAQERDHRVRETLPKAWQEVLRDPESPLPELLVKKVKEISGHLPDRETVAEFLQGVSETGSTASELLPSPPSTAELAGQVAPAKGSAPSRREAVTSEREDFSGRSPRAFWLNGSRYEATRWNEVLRGTCDQLAKETGAAFGERAVRVKGRTNPYFSEDPRSLTAPKELKHSALYVEVAFDAKRCVDVARRVIEKVLDSDGGFSFEFADELPPSPPSTAEPAGQVAPAKGSTPSRREAVTSEREDFSGRSPRAFWLDGSRYEATRWNEVLRGTCDQLAKETGAVFGERAVRVKGKKNPYFSEDPGRLNHPLRLKHTALYVEGKFNANHCVTIARRVLDKVRGSSDGFCVEVADPN